MQENQKTGIQSLDRIIENFNPILKEWNLLSLTYIQNKEKCIKDVGLAENQKHDIKYIILGLVTTLAAGSKNENALLDKISFLDEPPYLIFGNFEIFSQSKYA